MGVYSDAHLFPTIPMNIARNAIKNPPFCLVNVTVAPWIFPWLQFVQNPR
jgi:hypothetical protein